MYSRCCFLFILFCPKSANVAKLDGENGFLAVKLRSSNVCLSNSRYAMPIKYITISSWIMKSILGQRFVCLFVCFCNSMKGRNAFFWPLQLLKKWNFFLYQYCIAIVPYYLTMNKWFVCQKLLQFRVRVFLLSEFLQLCALVNQEGINPGNFALIKS